MMIVYPHKVDPKFRNMMVEELNLKYLVYTQKTFLLSIVYGNFFKNILIDKTKTIEKV